MLTIDTLIDHDLERGVTVVTPSPQRAAAVRLAYGVSRIARGARAWRTPDAVAYRAWLEREAFRAADAGEPVLRPLPAAAEWLLWLEAAAEASPAPESLPPETAGEPAAHEVWQRNVGSGGVLAESLSRAARLMVDWGIPRGVLRSSPHGEGERLALALEHVEARSRELRAAPSHALGSLLQGWRSRPATFAGFTERSPTRGAWLEASGRGPPVRERHSEATAGRLLTACAGAPDEELELAASWCRAQLSEDPARRLLVVVPDLSERRSEAVRALEQALAPRAALGGAEESGCVAVEGGEPLAGYPLVRHALGTLGFLTGALGLAQLSAWLRAAFWRSPAGAERARLDAWLRRALAAEVAPRELLGALGTAPAGLGGPAGELGRAVEAALQALGPPGEPAPIRRWAQRFERALDALGWPGARPLTSAEQQTKTRLAQLLADLVAAGGSLGGLEAPQALRMLEALAARTSFAPQSAAAAVTLTGALGDPIVRYDGIWVAGLHGEAWPPPPAASPFIPLFAQIRAGVPGVTATGSLARARSLLERWRRSAPELVVSWPARIDDRECLASPLLAEQPGEMWTPGGREPALARSIRSTRRAESFTDDRGSPWPAADPLPAGTRAIDLQSRCPFRSYAELRLSCVPLEAPRPGIDPRERGRLVHGALEHLWRELGGSERLQQESLGGGLARLIEDCVARAAGEIFPPPSTPSAEAGQRRERRRTEQLLLELAALERERPAFRVSALELARSLTLGGARLNLRIDRIDELEDGTRIVLDYKTGKPAPLDWLADRLTDPQLPLYSLAAGGYVGALAAVHLTAGRVTYRGLADRAGRLPRIAALAGQDSAAPAAWQDQVRKWRALLEQLARDFLAGSAPVDPVESACRICHLHTLCRVSEARESRGA